MNYNLAKQLKDAGFTQHDGPTVPLGGCYIGENNQTSLGTFDKGFVYAPPLSELIEACGDGFSQVGHEILQRRTEDWPVDKEWHASGKNVLTEITNVYVHAYGSTPEEAVAKLWLELNTCLACQKNDGRMHTCKNFR